MRRVIVSLLFLSCAIPLAAQETVSSSGSGSYDRKDAFPNLNLYLPEGQASIRLRKLIKNVLFESQIDYRFVNGDISTFLRYKYYARNFTYKIGVFDQIGFPSVEKGSLDFQRVRGGLVLFELPRNYNNRYFGLIQNDRLRFGDPTDPDNRKNNIYAKIGYQYGTPFDERLNSIVGESRGRITPVLTAFRDVGPQRTAIAAAITESGKIATGSYQYTKIETEGLRRWDVSSASFLVTRLHFGAMLGQQTIRGPEFPQVERYSIPLYDMFQLGGRDALKGVRDTASDGTDEMHFTNEFFMPVFRNRDLRTWLLHWNTMYAIGYLGAGDVGFTASSLFKPRNYVADAGLGTETGLTVRDFDVLLSLVVAHTVRAPEALKGTRVRFSIRTIR
jgi:hypothetical protein